MANIIIFFIISLSSFDNLCFVGSFDNILIFFPLIIINLWFVCFFDDSIRVRLVPLIISVLVHFVPLIFYFFLICFVSLLLYFLFCFIFFLLFYPCFFFFFCYFCILFF